MTAIHTATFLSLAALLCAYAVTQRIGADPGAVAPEDLEAPQGPAAPPSASLGCSRRCEDACGHFWWGRDRRCTRVCDAVCRPTVGVSTPCVAEQADAETETGRGSTHAACWRQCASGCRPSFAPRGGSGSEGGNDKGDVCRDICLRFLSSDY